MPDATSLEQYIDPSKLSADFINNIAQGNTGIRDGLFLAWANYTTMYCTSADITKLQLTLRPVDLPIMMDNKLARIIQTEPSDPIYTAINGFVTQNKGQYPTYYDFAYGKLTNIGFSYLNSPDAAKEVINIYHTNPNLAKALLNMLAVAWSCPASVPGMWTEGRAIISNAIQNSFALSTTDKADLSAIFNTSLPTAANGQNATNPAYIARQMYASYATLGRFPNYSELTHNSFGLRLDNSAPIRDVVVGLAKIDPAMALAFTRNIAIYGSNPTDYPGGGDWTGYRNNLFNKVISSANGIDDSVRKQLKNILEQPQATLNQQRQASG